MFTPDVLNCFSYMQTWTTIPASQATSHPAARAGHSAVSLHDPDSDPAHPAVLVMWGAGGGKILKDCWIFHLNQEQWRKVCTWQYVTHRKIKCDTDTMGEIEVPYTLGLALFPGHSQLFKITLRHKRVWGNSSCLHNIL